jgi:DNA-binding beta-propeller fold protein YncE
VSPALAACALFLAVLTLTGCAAPVSIYATKPASNLKWPRLSGGPQITWIKTIATYQDAGIAKGFWKRALELLTGEDESRIVRPYGVLIDASERLFIADPGAGRVHFMDIKEGIYTIIGNEDDSPLLTPIGLAEDEHDNLYITDSNAATVFIYDIKKKNLKPFIRQQIKRPTGIAYDRRTKLIHIVDTAAGQVVTVDEAGNRKRTIGSPGAEIANFNHPTDIGIDRRGQIYVTDPLNYRIKVFSPEGQLVNQLGSAGDGLGELNKPKGVAVDSDGHIYVCDALLDTVQIFDNTGRLLLFFGTNGTDNGQFWMPSGIFIDQNDYIFVTDTYNRRVQVFRYLSANRAAGVEEKK